jgi:hypothetical protein
MKQMSTAHHTPFSGHGAVGHWRSYCQATWALRMHEMLALTRNLQVRLCSCWNHQDKQTLMCRLRISAALQSDTVGRHQAVHYVIQLGGQRRSTERTVADLARPFHLANCTVQGKLTRNRVQCCNSSSLTETTVNSSCLLSERYVNTTASTQWCRMNMPMSSACAGDANCSSGTFSDEEK